VARLGKETESHRFFSPAHAKKSPLTPGPIRSSSFGNLQVTFGDLQVAATEEMSTMKPKIVYSPTHDENKLK
jgi:hypothetical protein